MLNALKFVQGSIAKADFIPALTHFCIERGTVRGYNGTLALCSPIPFDIACKPKAETMVQAIKNCSETVSLSMTPSGRLSIKSGKFKALIECVEGSTPHVMPEGKRVEIDGEQMLAAMKIGLNFISDNNSKPWANGMLFTGQSAIATINVALVEYWTGFTIPIPINIPKAAVKEMLRIGEAPKFAQVSENSATFHYGERKWIRTQLLPTDWPDLSRILDKQTDQKPIDTNLFEAMSILKPFASKSGRMVFEDGCISTSRTDEGAKYEIEGLKAGPNFNVEVFNTLKGVAKTIDFTSYPQAVIFQGDRLRGAIIGMQPE